MLDHLLSTIAPHICCNCRNVGALLCQSCANDIIEDGFGVCVECLIPTYSSNLCKSCRRRSPYDDVFVVSWRTAGLKRLIDTYKFERGKEASIRLAWLLDRRLPELPADARIVPVPTLRRHRRIRGYGHVELVAKTLGKRRKLTVSPLLERTGNAVQHGKSKAERAAQAKDMFELRAMPPDSPLLIIDDIYTTGSTARAAARLIRQQTDAPIYLAIIARQPLDDSSDL